MNVDDTNIAIKVYDVTTREQLTMAEYHINHYTISGWKITHQQFVHYTDRDGQNTVKLYITFTSGWHKC